MVEQEIWSLFWSDDKKLLLRADAIGLFKKYIYISFLRNKFNHKWASMNMAMPQSRRRFIAWGEIKIITKVRTSIK